MNLTNFKNLLSAIQENPDNFHCSVFHELDKHCVAGIAQLLSKGVPLTTLVYMFEDKYVYVAYRYRMGSLGTREQVMSDAMEYLDVDNDFVEEYDLFSIGWKSQTLESLTAIYKEALLQEVNSLNSLG